MDYLGDDGVPVSLDGLLPPGRKGNTVQLTGNPIISATNRGLSWKLLPAWAKKSGRLPCRGFFPVPCRRDREQPVEVQEIRQAVGVLLPVLCLVHGRASLTFPAFHPLPVVYLRRCRGGQQHLADDLRQAFLLASGSPYLEIRGYRRGQQTRHDPFCAGHRRHKPE